MDNDLSPARGPSASLKLVICGGGPAAIMVLQAWQQRSGPPVDVTILEPRARLGVGVAYSTNCPSHLLNTRACNMSITDDPDDFVSWLRAARPRRVLNWTRDDFAPRSCFADYLQTRLAQIRATSGIRVTWLHSSADSVTPRGQGWEVVPAHGEPIHADLVLVATGNEAPRQIGAQLPPPAQRLIIEDPWDAEQKSDIPKDAAVLLAGTSLTAVDIITELLHRRHEGPIVAVSRRGLLPRPHGPIAAAPEGFVHALPSSLRDVVRFVRGLSNNDPRGDKWRRAFTELRGIAPSLWRNWTVAERKRFLRHVRPFWDAHRHRVAPRVHAKVARAIQSGQVRIVRGRIESIEHQVARDGLRVTVRHGYGTRTLDAARLVNCTGPEPHPAHSVNPLLQGLLGDGLARADALGLGLAVDADSRVVATNGSAHASLYALGTLTRGTRWEVTAVPEIREQAGAIVRRILHDRASEQASSLTSSLAHKLSAPPAARTLLQTAPALR
jgi:uncharacterized NAD(P)/FAD-binding protein YdhS